MGHRNPQVVLAVGQVCAVGADKVSGLAHDLRHRTGQVGRVGVVHPPGVNVGLRGGPGIERGVVACLAGGGAVKQAGGAGVARVSVSEAGERVIDNDGLPGFVGLRSQGRGERDVPEPRFGVVGDAGAEHNARLLGAGSDESGSGCAGQVQGRRADGWVGQFAFEGAPVLLAGQR